MGKIIRRLLCDTRGATAVEYGLILALIFLAMIGAIKSVTSETINKWEYVTEKVTTT